MDLTAYLDAHAVRAKKGGMPHDKEMLSDFLASYDEQWNPLLEAARAGRTDTNTRHELAPERRDWLSVSAANRMIQVLLIHGRTQDAFTVIQKLEAAGEFPRVETLNTFLSAASKARDAESAIAALQFFAPYLDTIGRSDRRSGKIHLNDWSFTILFTIAWRGQCYNLLRTIWRYGVCSGQIDSKVLSRMRSSLLTYVPTRPSYYRQQVEKAAQEQRQREWETAFGHLSHRKMGVTTARPDEVEFGVQAMGIKERDLFFGWAAKFAVGVEGDAASSSSSSSSPAADAADDESGELSPASTQLSEQDHQILDFSTRPRTTPDDRDTLPDLAREGVESAHRDRYAYFNDLLRRDLAAAGNFRPIKPLVQAAEEAFHLDLQWKRRRMGKMTAELDEVFNGRAASEQGILSEEVECSRARRLGGMFREMLSEGVKIPVRVGDMSRG
ncbi:hypothetical protein KC316_g16984 [Hortaea werneckii]|nr:hypothetical protein KC324_g16102 [Hortaea werneckii]KAI7532478.1 hypothetical protein KC316_g16984 [Hortaea werneckii]